VACVVAPLVARRTGIGRRALALWGASVVAFGVLVASFDAAIYGGVFKTGYSSGEIQFAWSAIVPNLHEMPQKLAWSMPLVVLALAAVVWIGARLWLGLPGARRDAAVAGALAGVWLGIYGLYLAYTWTAGQSAGRPGGPGGDVSVHLIRFYVPALGALALLAAWLVHQLPRQLALVAIVAIGGVEYPKLASGGGMPPFGRGHGGFGLPGQRPGFGPPPGGIPSGPPPSGYFP
jgi:hypothetical protein